jgi:hypothetical protein
VTPCGENLIDGAADHHPDNVALSRVSEKPVSNQFAVTENQVAIGDAFDLLELVADEKNGLAVPLQQFNDTEKLLDFL